MAYSNNWLDLEKKLIKAVSSTLQNEVAETIRDVEVENIIESVYSVYSPKVYERRQDSGGLSDKNNMKLKVVDNLTIEIVNETPANLNFGGTDKPLDKLIEYGHENPYRYDYPRDGAAYMEARPFTENTINDLKQNKQHIKALKEGLQKRGVNTK